MRHKAYDLYPQDARQVRQIAEWEGRNVTSALDALMRAMGWHRMETSVGRIWVNDTEALSLYVYGVSGRLTLKKAGYRQASGRTKHKAAMKISAEVRQKRARKAALARWRKQK